MTKRTCIPIFLFFFMILLFINSASAQNKEVLPADVLRMERKATDMLSSIAYRSTMTGETFPARDQDANSKTVLIREILPPDRYREIQENTENGKWNRRELVAVGGKYFQRFDNGPWREYPPPPDYKIPGTATAPAVAAKPKVESKAWLVETLTENGHAIAVYEYKSTSTREIDGKSITQMTTSRFWFRDDGMLLKKFAELETLGDPRVISNTTVYEYDNVKIEAPIIP
jgi:hypothetical protein